MLHTYQCIVCTVYLCCLFVAQMVQVALKQIETLSLSSHKQLLQARGPHVLFKSGNNSLLLFTTLL